MTAARASSNRAETFGVVGAFVVLLALLVIVRWPAHARYLYEWDSVQYARAAIEFDVYRHQPHPPGYPLWVLALWGFVRLGLDANTAQIALALLFAAGALAFFYRLTLRLSREGTPAVAVACLAFAPGVALYCSVAANYTADLFTSAAIGLLAARLWEGERRVAPWACGLLAAMMGVRPSGAMMMAPLLAVALMRALRLDWRAWALALAPGAFVLAAWLVPLARMHDGLLPLWRFSRAAVEAHFKNTSLLYGASADQHRAMVENGAKWIAMDLAVPVAVVLLLALLTRIVPVRPDPVVVASPPPTFHRPAFYALWILPNLAAVFLIHAPKPGYVLVSIPPILLAAMPSIDRNLRSVARLASTTNGPPAAVLALVVAGAATLLGSTRFGDPVLERSSVDSVRAADADVVALLSIAHAPEHSAERTLLVVVDGLPIGPNVAVLRWYLPRTEILFYEVGSGWSTTATNLHPGALPESIDRILWLDHPEATNFPEIVRVFGDTAMIHRGGTLSVASTELGGDDLRVTLQLRDGALLLARTGATTVAAVTFGEGFSGVEASKEAHWRWASGPVAHLDVMLPKDADVALKLVVDQFVPGQRIVLCDARRDLATFTDLSTGHDLRSTFRGHRGHNEITLHFDRWNGHPAAFAPRDPRLLAVSFREILVEADGRPANLVEASP